MTELCAECCQGIGPARSRYHAKYCSDECRYKAKDRGKAYEYKRKLTCAGCSAPIYQGPGSRPQGVARCRGCWKVERASAPRADSHVTCADCGVVAYGVRCRPCSSAYRRANAGTTPRPDREARLRRYYTDKAAPGLNSWEKRRVLLCRWQQQGRRCAYCPGQAETVDHVIPLIRGGSNYEGNLVPCCLDCNVRKSDRLLIEWRLSKRASAGRVAVVIPPKAEPKAKPITGVELALKQCARCDALHYYAGQYCGSECRDEAHREKMRNRYRERVGIPVDAPLYSVIKRVA